MRLLLPTLRAALLSRGASAAFSRFSASKRDAFCCQSAGASNLAAAQVNSFCLCATRLNCNVISRAKGGRIARFCDTAKSGGNITSCVQLSSCCVGRPVCCCWFARCQNNNRANPLVARFRLSGLAGFASLSWAPLGLVARLSPTRELPKRAR